MKSIELSDQTAFKLYPTASTEMKTILEENWGKEFFKRKITDLVKTFEDACNVLQISNTTLPDVSMLPEDQRKSLLAHYKLIIIIKALNEGWTPDWNNSNQKKWYPLFYLNNPGVRFNDAYYYCMSSCWGGGSRLCLKSEELAIYAGKQFVELYKQLMVI